MGILAAFAVPHPPLIIPAVGRGKEREIQATIDAYTEVGRRIAELRPDTIVLSSPHSVVYYDYVHISPGTSAEGSFSEFGAAQARYSATYDEEFVEELSARAADAGIPAGTDGERDPRLDHATMIPLHFIQRIAGYADFRLVRMGISGLSPLVHYELGEQVSATADALGRSVVYVASGDLSHKTREEGPYGFAPEGPDFDDQICDIFSTGDFLRLLQFDPGFCERAAECGLRSFQIMAGALDRTPVSAELLAFEDVFGVGYGTAAFVPTADHGSDPRRDFGDQYADWHQKQMTARKAAEDPYVSLARSSLEAYVCDGRRIEPPEGLPDALVDTRAGAFVSLKKDGELRGCIGTILPTQSSLAKEICANAISAGTHDPRFSRVRPDELPELVYDVDVLTEPEPIDSSEELDPRRYGVIVSTDDGRRGLLLPDLDGVDTIDEQISIAAQKGGISLESDEVMLERFEVVRHT